MEDRNAIRTLGASGSRPSTLLCLEAGGDWAAWAAADALQAFSFTLGDWLPPTSWSTCTPTAAVFRCCSLSSGSQKLPYHMIMHDSSTNETLELIVGALNSSRVGRNSRARQISDVMCQMQHGQIKVETAGSKTPKVPGVSQHQKFPECHRLLDAEAGKAWQVNIQMSLVEGAKELQDVHRESQPPRVQHQALQHTGRSSTWGAYAALLVWS